MKLAIIAIRDIKANCFGQPNFVTNIGSAIRSFGDECQREDRNNMLYMHPEDFELYELGWWGDGDAHFEIYNDGPRQIAVGSNYRK